jgi:hypothetical protein
MNNQQKKRFNKLREENFFLLNFEENKFFISGSTKNVYIIDWLEDLSFYCNCPDMQSRAKNYNIYCKHICFIYNKIGKFNRLEFYKKKKVNEEEKNILINKLNKIKSSSIIDDTIQNKDLIDIFKLKITNNNENNNEFTKNILNKSIEEDDCPICFDDFITSDNLFCQSCGNVVHKKCIEKWLETNFNCIFCRSDIWKDYGKKIKYLKL